jgi:MFS family permease
VHPQFWPGDLDYAGKRVVVIGSGATAVTIVPEMAKAAAHVTMLQRSPTYIVSRPSEDKAADWLRKRLPAKLAYRVARVKNMALGMYFYHLARKNPEKIKQQIIAMARHALGPDYDVGTHFTPSYNPWDQRLCLVPDSDLFDAIRTGKASVSTGHIETFTETGIRLRSGEEIEADIVVMATGLKLNLLGDVGLTVDGSKVDLSKALAYKGMMFSGVPNLASVIGYTNASWTLKADITCEYVCRVLNHMRRRGYKAAPPRRDASVDEEPFFSLTSGYVQRGVAMMPKQGGMGTAIMSSQAIINPSSPSFGTVWNRQLPHYSRHGVRSALLLLVVTITVSLYYQLYVGGGVATLMLTELRMPFGVFVVILAIGNLLGAFGSLLAGLADRFGRANLIVYGLLIVALMTLFALPNVTTPLQFAVASSAVAFVEGVVLVTTPALMRDFSPQVGRAAAMGFWTVGPVLGSLMVSAVNTLTLPTFETWQSQFYICGAVGLVMFVVAFFGLRELAPELRDQFMVGERDRMLVELRAKGLDVEASLRRPWSQILHLDVIAPAIGVSTLLIFYYTAVAFGTIYLVTVFQFTVAQANALANWTWAANAVSPVAAGVCSDRLRVRKPFMLVGGVGAAILMWFWLSLAGQHPSFLLLVAISCAQSLLVGFAYTAWMAGFTETVEARNPALTATGLAVWGWLLRLVVTACFLALPYIVDSVTPVIEAPPVFATYKDVLAAKAAPSPDLLARLGAIQKAAAETAGQWQIWYWVCIAGVALFVATIFTMRGRWSPAAAKADVDAHDALVARELAALQTAQN